MCLISMRMHDVSGAQALTAEGAPAVLCAHVANALRAKNDFHLQSLNIPPMVFRTSD